MVKISLSFTAGIIAATLLDAGPFLSSAALALCCTSILAVNRGLIRGDFPICMCFFLAGLFCGCNAAISPGLAPRIVPEFLKGASDAMKDAVDASPFGENRTKALLKALLFGDRTFLDRDISTAFRRAGAAHILALSGLHLGIISTLLRRILGICGNTRAAFASRNIITIAVCGLYAVMTGASPSVMRAFLFMSLKSIASLMPHRSCPDRNVFCTALTIQLAANPLVLRSTAFQLSYLAMAGIFTVFPVLKSWFPASRRNPLGRIWEAAALAISCQMFTAPLVWVRFHSFPKYFLLTNLIALPLTELLMVSGIVTVAASAIGLSPLIGAKLTDRLAGLLVGSLDIISKL